MKDLGIGSICNSALRLAKAEEKLKEMGGPFWPHFLRRESGILLRRAFKLWWRLHFNRQAVKAWWKQHFHRWRR